jgi:hypothetical protein
MLKCETPPPPFPIGEVARRLDLHPRTLMAWERLGLVKPARCGGRRVYTEGEIRWVGCLQAFNRHGGISLQGLSALLRFVPCWAIRAELESGSAPCVPSDYPAAECLTRVSRAYAADAPAACHDCGIYRGHAASSRRALHEAWNRPPGADGRRLPDTTKENP